MALEDAAVDVPSSEPSAADRLVAAELSERVGEALERLPSGQRIVLALSVYEGLTVAEIAEVVGSKASRVKANLWHARRRMKELLPDLVERPAGRGDAT